MIRLGTIGRLRRTQILGLDFGSSEDAVFVVDRAGNRICDRFGRFVTASRTTFRVRDRAGNFIVDRFGRFLRAGAR